MDRIRNRKDIKVKAEEKKNQSYNNEIVEESKKSQEKLNYTNRVSEVSEKKGNISENETKCCDHKIHSSHISKKNNCKRNELFQIHFQVDGVSLSLFLLAFITRVYKLQEPKNVVFDELHYGKYISLYMQNTFFFYSNPPLGIQLISLMAYLVGYDGKYKFEMIGKPYSSNVPIFALRFLPALFGSLLIPISYHLILELGFSQWTAIFGAVLILLDTSLLTQSRFILMESLLITFSAFGLFCFLRFCRHQNKPYSFLWWFWLLLGSISLTCSLCVKYVGLYSYFLGLLILFTNFWSILSCKDISDQSLIKRFLTLTFVVMIIPLLVYLGIFYVHLNLLYKAGPHDNIMTSAFQASLEGGLASITKGQPLIVAHGSQITLRHSHGRTCWLHSHPHVYPIRYPDGRGSSHQQQVTCYSFKDVNNWWIIKRPEKNDLIVEKPVDPIKHGDLIQLVHGLTSRALNSHDVAAPMSPQCQEVSCYIDYNVSMPAQNLWRVDIINREQTGDTWHAIQSQVRLIHVDSNQALKYSGRQLPDWGFHQHEVVTDRVVHQDDTIWNVEEHVYTKSEDQKDREREMIAAEMIPTKATKLSFWDKFFELQYKMLFKDTESVQSHMFSSEPLEWPLMSRGIAYWVSSTNNAQVHLLGNIVIWYTATFGLLCYCSLLVFYLLRRRRLCFDLDEYNWELFKSAGLVFFTGYFFHYLPYFFIERTLFLHNYLHAYYFKVLLLTTLFEHIYFLLKYVVKNQMLLRLFLLTLFTWMFFVLHVFKKFSILSYGTTDLMLSDIRSLKWRDSWDFIFHKT